MVKLIENAEDFKPTYVDPTVTKMCICRVELSLHIIFLKLEFCLQKYCCHLLEWAPHLQKPDFPLFMT